MNKVTHIFWNGFKNATLVFLTFFLVILTMVVLNNEAGISLIFKSDTYLDAIRQPVVIGVYFLLLALATLNSYKKSKS